LLRQFFEQHDVIGGVAIYLGQQLDLRRFPQDTLLATSPLAVTTGTDGVAVLFRYGVVVLLGMQAVEVVRFTTDILNLVSEPFDEPEQESFEILFSPDRPEGIDQGRIRLRSHSLQGLLIVADVLAKSTVLAHYEVVLREHFEHIEPLSKGLREGGRAGMPKGRKLLENIGDSLLIEAKMTGRIEVSEKPELIWDYPEYERLYLRLEDEFELAERHAAIDRKLGLISKTAQTLLGYIHNRQSLRVEWYIVILIVAEIVITMVDKLF
jgi:uncharacterized Rmd1/YagE family protein